jgi:uncharacterized protein with FMN-binding domain
MKRIALWILSTVTVLVLVFGYHTSTAGALDTGNEVAAPSGSGGGTAAGGQTVTGPVAQTRWGPVQVRVTVADGSITDVSVVRYPDGNHEDEEINARALPILVRETLDAQSDQIDMVTGATVTSEGYLESLQGALDEAGL